MSEVAFEMWEPFRQKLIAEHNFYVEQAHKRLLSQFENISEEASQAEEKYLEDASIYFDPDIHGPDYFFDEAFEKSCEFYNQLMDMKNHTTLGVVAGMFHQWDKNLRDWLYREIVHCHKKGHFADAIWGANFQEIMDFLEGFGFHCKKEIYQHLDAMRLVVNVFKHGNGSSFRALKSSFPEFLGVSTNGKFSCLFYNYTDLTVSDPQLEQFSNAILGFWRAVPYQFFLPDKIELPKKFEDAYNKDCRSQKKFGG